MIIKSMSRKEPSFSQLAAYMSDAKSDRDFDLHAHVFERDPEAIADEFARNARFIGKRRNGNYLYHEILSLDTRACGQSREVKEKLRLLALDYVERRCPRNLVYGALHQDHEGHLHYHLMISANEKESTRRHRLPKARYETIKQETERLAREQYPELKQDRIMELAPDERRARREQRKVRQPSRKAQEMEKRGARLTKKEALAQELRSLMAYAGSQREFERLLKDKGYAFYTRGKTIGIRPLEGADGKKPKAHRFATLGVADEYSAFLDRVEPVLEDDPDRAARADARDDAGEFAGEKEKERGEERDREGQAEARDARDPHADAQDPSRSAGADAAGAKENEDRTAREQAGQAKAGPDRPLSESEAQKEAFLREMRALREKRQASRTQAKREGRKPPTLKR